VITVSQQLFSQEIERSYRELPFALLRIYSVLPDRYPWGNDYEDNRRRDWKEE
jgi:hypothetical protein